MVLFRLVFGLLGVAGLLCFAAYIATGQAVWRQRGVIIIKWTLIAVLGCGGAFLFARRGLKAYGELAGGLAGVVGVASVR